MLYHPERLNGCHADLLRVFIDVGENYDCEVVQGARTLAAEQADEIAGTSHLHNPADSLHVITPTRPYALAADVAPVTLTTGTPVIDWNDTMPFWHFAGYVLAAADRLGIKITWGGAWNGRTGWNHPGQLNDLDHFQKA